MQISMVQALKRPSYMLEWSSALVLDSDKKQQALGYETRSVFFLWKQVSKLTGIRPRATGSRYYSHYWTAASDWDFYLGQPSKPHFDLLTSTGWSRHDTKYGTTSFYRGIVNILAPRTPREVFHVAASTASCMADKPLERQEALKRWQHLAEVIKDEFSPNLKELGAGEEDDLLDIPKAAELWVAQYEKR